VDYIAPLLFLMFSTILGGAAFALMWKSLSSINSVPRRKRHPEVAEIRDGDELLVARINPVSCDLEEYGELQARIKKLRQELEDFGEDDEDDDGDIPALVRR